jgi:hypothetical protein
VVNGFKNCNAAIAGKAMLARVEAEVYGHFITPLTKLSEARLARLAAADSTKRRARPCNDARG